MQTVSKQEAAKLSNNKTTKRSRQRGQDIEMDITSADFFPKPKEEKSDKRDNKSRKK